MLCSVIGGRGANTFCLLRGNCVSTSMLSLIMIFIIYFFNFMNLPCYFKSKMQFALGPLCDVNSIKYIMKRLKCPCDFTLT
jgi:hypothetical protein